MDSKPSFSVPVKIGRNVQLKVGKETFHVCKEIVANLSEFFAKLLTKNPEEKSEIEINDVSADDMRCFFEATVPHPGIRIIDDDNLETLMRLSVKFECLSLKQSCASYIANTFERYSATAALEVLTWMKNYDFDYEKPARCLMASVACLSLDDIDKHRNAIGIDRYGKIMAVKCRRNYERANQVTSNSGNENQISCECSPDSKFRFDPSEAECHCADACVKYYELLKDFEGKN